MFRPDIFKAAMDTVVDRFDFPGRRIGRDGKRRGISESDHRRTKLVGFPGFNLRFRCSIFDGKDRGGWDRQVTHPLDRISGLKRFDFPLLVVRYGPQVRDNNVRFPFHP